MSSDLIADRCTSEATPHPLIEAYPARHTLIGQLEIRRALPVRERRLVGPWCFLDRYGPLTFTAGKPMDLGPHPHIGLQTVSYLLDGEVVHHDSLGYESLLRPGAVNLMTSGRGIAHAEETPHATSGSLNGVQLWIAMPDETRSSFEHREDLRRIEVKSGSMTMFVDTRSHIGADMQLAGSATFALKRSFEHALLVLDGSAELENQPLIPDVLYYLGTGRDELSIAARDGARILLIGGTPFRDTILMWWNFVARTSEELVAAREDWARGERFGEVRGAEAPRVDAPPLSGKARPPAAS
jgi:redox-sensitive bicupin YhaK (pirin superfamily)